MLFQKHQSVVSSPGHSENSNNGATAAALSPLGNGSIMSQNGLYASSYCPCPSLVQRGSLLSVGLRGGEGESIDNVIGFLPFDQNMIA